MAENSTVLKLYNAKIKEKEVFNPHNKQILWITCRPKVYYRSYMGIVSSHIRYDAIRRVLTDYFKYDVLYVMNINDIDNTPHRNARQDYFYEKYIMTKTRCQDFIKEVENSLTSLDSYVDNIVDSDKYVEFRKYIEPMVYKVHSSLNKLLNIQYNESNEKIIDAYQKHLLIEAENPLAHYIEVKSQDADPDIFDDGEYEFYHVLNMTNTMKPNIVTRVSKYIPEIIKYIKKIIDKGIAYVTDGRVYYYEPPKDKIDEDSIYIIDGVVYFDANPVNKAERRNPVDNTVHRFDSADKTGSKFNDKMPCNDCDEMDVIDLMKNVKTTAKKLYADDIPLWIPAKNHELGWDSPWGRGRPTSHIECTAIGSIIADKNMDIHSESADLCTHQNYDLIKAEANFGNSQFVFETPVISKPFRKAIPQRQIAHTMEYTKMQFRLACLMQSRDQEFTCGDNMKAAAEYEDFFKNFFKGINYQRIRYTDDDIIPQLQKWTPIDIEMNKRFSVAKDVIHRALCDNIDTAETLGVLKILMIRCNKYLQEIENPNMQLIKNIAIYITKMLKMLGIHPPCVDNWVDIGFSVFDEYRDYNYADVVSKHYEIILNFYKSIRNHALATQSEEILDFCNKLRRELIIKLDVFLQSHGTDFKEITLGYGELIFEKDHY